MYNYTSTQTEQISIALTIWSTSFLVIQSLHVLWIIIKHGNKFKKNIVLWYLVSSKQLIHKFKSKTLKLNELKKRGKIDKLYSFLLVY